MPNTSLRIGAKVLAALTLPNFCQRCFWYRQHAGTPPFSAFPSIFNEIDRYTKRTVESIIDEDEQAPEWMGEALSEAVGYEDVGSLKWHDEENDILLTGIPDVVLYGKDRLEWFVADYKTARYSAGQDVYLEQYRNQLLGYAFLLEKLGYRKPQTAALFYFGPPAKPSNEELLKRAEKQGFAMPLTVEVVEIELGDTQRIPELLKQAREIYDQENCPPGREGCRDCKALNAYIRTSYRDKNAKSDYSGIDRIVLDSGQKRYKVQVDVSCHDQDYGAWYPSWGGE